MSLCPESKTNLLVIFLEPAVYVSKTAVSPLSNPVTVSPAEKEISFKGINVMGVEMFTTLAFAPDVPPVIISPLVNTPEDDVKVHCGKTGSVALSSESKTA